MFTMRISPKLSVKPLASRNRRAAKEMPLIAWRIPLCMGRRKLRWRTRNAADGATGAPSAIDEADLPLVGTALEELFWRPSPELRDVLVGLDRNVRQGRSEHRMVYLLNARDVDVLDRVVVVVHLERASRRFDRRGP